MSHPGTAPHTLQPPSDAYSAVNSPSDEMDKRTPFFNPELSDKEVETELCNHPLFKDIGFYVNFPLRSKLHRLILEDQDDSDVKVPQDITGVSNH